MDFVQNDEVIQMRPHNFLLSNMNFMNIEHHYAVHSQPLVNFNRFLSTKIKKYRPRVPVNK